MTVTEGTRSFLAEGIMAHLRLSLLGPFRLSLDDGPVTGIKSNKEVFLSGTVDALVKNEYLVDQAKGRNPNFEEQDAVDNYMALQPGDALFGTENFKSSAVFGGVGAKVTEAYNVQQMEFRPDRRHLWRAWWLWFRTSPSAVDRFSSLTQCLRPTCSLPSRRSQS